MKKATVTFTEDQITDLSRILDHWIIYTPNGQYNKAFLQRIQIKLAKAKKLVK
jgi:hypothetical protein